jgi:phosphoribosyl 1,2-cyclic phosphate phosphodiesterase
MEVIFLGTGTSQGVPQLALPNPGLDLSNPKNWRTRTSVHVVMDGYHIQVDAGPDFRTQCLRENIADIDVFFLTHGHSDHILGMDDLRAFCEKNGSKPLDVYATQEGLERVQVVFPYAIRETPLMPGYPVFRLNEMPSVLETPGGKIYSTRLPHGRIDTLGLVFEEHSKKKRFVYYPDCKSIPPEAMELARGAEVIVLDGLRHHEHPAHMTIAEATAVALELKGHQTYLTHMSFLVDHQSVCDKLPVGVTLAYDGLQVFV